MLALLYSFWKRRIQIDVDRFGLVLDVGSGDKPHWRADIFVDAMIDDSHSSQRSAGGSVAIVGPLFQADLADLPFRDKIFDYVICSHVLEHVIDPISCIYEMVRVGKRGYIELPFAGLQKIHDFPVHLWFCDKTPDGTLIFTAKPQKHFDAQITQFISYPKILSGLARTIRWQPDCAFVQLWWEEKISVQIEGSPNIELLNEKEPPNTSRLSWSIRFIYLLIRSLCRIAFRSRLRISPIHHNQVIKDELWTKVDFILKKDVYKLKGGNASTSNKLLR